MQTTSEWSKTLSTNRIGFRFLLTNFESRHVERLEKPFTKKESLKHNDGNKPPSQIAATQVGFSERTICGPPEGVGGIASYGSAKKADA